LFSAAFSETKLM